MAGDSCCPMGANQTTDADCTAVCGNGVLEAGEKCDFAITSGAGACPASCPTTNPCMPAVLGGAGCNAACTTTTITTPSGTTADGCCPSGATHSQDIDCSSTCGDGTLDPGEACDNGIASGTGSCPANAAACNDSNPCTVDTLAGSAANCTAACMHAAITTPSGATKDNCCPAGANLNTDADCTAMCGNGAVESGELCDTSIPAGSAGACPASADCTALNDSCTTYTLAGTFCTAHCVGSSKSPSGSTVDGCCPKGATSITDVDCMAVCGNGVVEGAAGESCDIAIASGSGSCPKNAATDCTPANTCDAPIITGTGCGAKCTPKAITTCSTTKDSCCPAGCTGVTGQPNTDADCSALCGDGIVEAGETCDTKITSGAGKCPASGAECATIAGDTDKCHVYSVQSAGTCNATCTFTTITTPGIADMCCPAGANANTDPDCAAVCGNGALEPGENCDTAIASGQPGACPTGCTQPDMCTSSTLTGTACAAHCVNAPIVPCCGNGVKENGENCDTGIPGGNPGACPTSAATDCNDSKPCTHDAISGTACQAQCTHAAIVPCCGNGVVETSAGEDCDVGIASGPGSCGTITCDDSIACTMDVAIYPKPADNGEPPQTAMPASPSMPGASGNACIKYCAHLPQASATSDSCCPPGVLAGQDADCLCTNGTKDTAAYEQCDDGNTVNYSSSDMCTNSCTLEHIAVGSPCAVASMTMLQGDCTFPNAPITVGSGMPYCILPSTLPGLTDLFVNGYCTYVNCDTRTAGDPATGGSLPYAVTSCPQLATLAQIAGGASPNALCVQLPNAPFGACVELCNPAHGNADCRINESNQLGPEAYRCTILSAGPPVVAGCLARQPNF